MGMGHLNDRIRVGTETVFVRDLDQAKHFYRDLLGLFEDRINLPPGRAQFATGTIPIRLQQVTEGDPKGKPGGDTRITLAVPSARSLLNRLGSNASGYQLHEDGSAEFIATDPDGNTMKVVQSDEFGEFDHGWRHKELREFDFSPVLESQLILQLSSFLAVRFGEDGLRLLPQAAEIRDEALLERLVEASETAQSLAEVEALLPS